MTEDIQARVRQILHEESLIADDVSALQPGDDLYDAGLTSLSSVQLVLALEENFETTFPDEYLRRERLASIAAITSLVEDTLRLSHGMDPARAAEQS